MTKAEEKELAKKSLSRLLKPGATVYTVIKHVSRSGMQRRIGIYVVRNNKVVDLAASVCDLLGHEWGGDGSVVVGGCGQDVAFYLVCELGQALFPKNRKSLNQVAI